jgi:hypothetical protein
MNYKDFVMRKMRKLIWMGCNSKFYGFYALLCGFIFRKVPRLWTLDGAGSSGLSARRVSMQEQPPPPPPATTEWKAALTSELVWTLREENNPILNY